MAQRAARAGQAAKAGQTVLDGPAAQAAKAGQGVQPGKTVPPAGAGVTPADQKLAGGAPGGGSSQLGVFPPLLLRAFGNRWFERGTLSMYFLNATTDREAVRAFVREQVEAGGRSGRYGRVPPPRAGRYRRFFWPLGRRRAAPGRRGCCRGPGRTPPGDVARPAGTGSLVSPVSSAAPRALAWSPVSSSAI